MSRFVDELAVGRTRGSAKSIRFFRLTVVAVAMVAASTLLYGKGKPPKDDPGAPPPEYEITYLGTLGGSWSVTYGLNDQGDVVGLSERADGSSGPFVYTAAGGMQDLNKQIINSGVDGPKDLIWASDVNGNGTVDLLVSSAFTDSVVALDGMTGELLGDFVSPGSQGLDNPHGLAFGLDGNLLVCSKTSSQVLLFDGTNGQPLGVFIDSVDQDSLGVDEPTCLLLGPDFDGQGSASDLYVTNRWTNEVLVYDASDGSFIDSLFPADETLYNSPFGLVMSPDGGSLLISFSVSDVIARYDFATQTLTDFARRVADLSQGDLAGPRQMTFGPNGDLYVACAHNVSKVLRYDSMGNFIDEFIPESQEGGLRYPIDVLFDAADNLIVTSKNSDQILVYQGPLGTNPGAFIDSFVPDSGWTLMTAADINNAGQIVGYGYPLGTLGNFTQAAYLYTPAAAGETYGTVQDLGIPGSTSARATAINSDGDVAGNFVSDNDGAWHVFLWQHDAETYVDVGPNLLASAMNDRNEFGEVQIAGKMGTPDGDRAFRYDSATGIVLDLGVLRLLRGQNHSDSQGYDINNFGEVIGWSTVARSTEHAFVYTDSDGLQDLETLGGDDSEGHSINDAGEAVGMADLSSNAFVAFGYNAEAGMFELEPQIINLPVDALPIVPQRINAAGAICGPRIDNFTGVTGEAYLITPLP